MNKAIIGAVLAFALLVSVLAERGVLATAAKW
jgi:hypothetical protein